MISLVVLPNAWLPSRVDPPSHTALLMIILHSKLRVALWFSALTRVVAAQVETSASGSSKYNLKLSTSKTVINPKSTVILGWIWNSGALQASPHRIAALASYSKLLETLGSLKSFIGAYKVLARVIPQCSALLSPLDTFVAGRQSHLAQSALCANRFITFLRLDDQFMDGKGPFGGSVLKYPAWRFREISSVDAKLPETSFATWKWHILKDWQKSSERIDCAKWAALIPNGLISHLPLQNGTVWKVGRILCKHLTDFLKTNLTKFAVIWVKRRQKAGFLTREVPKSQ